MSRMCSEEDDKTLEQHAEPICISNTNTIQSTEDNTSNHINDTESTTQITEIIIPTSERHRVDQQNDGTIAWLTKLKQETEKANIIRPAIDTKQLTKEQYLMYRRLERLYIFDGILFRQWVNRETKQSFFQYVVPRSKRLEILEKAHDDVTAGHLGSTKTVDRIKAHFYWPKWEIEVRQYVESCQSCQRLKAHNRTNTAPMQPIIAHYPYQIVTFDMTGPIVRTKEGYERIMVIVDHFSKYIDLYAVKTLEANEAARCLMKSIYKHGIPDQIISYQGTNFQSKIIKEICDVLDIRQTRTTAYHPQTDGQ